MWSTTDLHRRLKAARHLRTALEADERTTLYRLVNAAGDDLAGFTVDRFGPVGVLSSYQDFSEAQEQQLAEAVAEVFELESVYLKRRPLEARHAANVERERLSPEHPLVGPERPELEALEGGLRYRIRPGSDLSVGIFTDMRPARAWLRQQAPASVLNTFAYTCAFGLSARAGGGDTVKNLDASRKVLAWGRENYALNGFEAPESDFIYGDVFDWLSRFARRGQTFEAVILDPPSFARGKSGTFRAERDYDDLTALAARVVAPGGLLLAATNHAGVPRPAFERTVTSGLEAAGRRAVQAQRLGAGEDYPTRGEGHLKVWALRLN
ncbi:23S rRNA (cytosine1962-C5)-methyltransferase [Deinobacterium chartae]|uniref:23S rRNA (Cytosine1962-C5)-methyltransferase n=1 Tax=Deinobacterium chartae TaxID=521158 RepID=A0A841HVU8_9DEIO|nr:class I SAM-dependent rRNA methyltransferase [Deinobacterium chartae]MBB6097517.1 23S rRNA (cytosine1962-C5)-methyltransferase [Deinobacterium chartae]